jgi:hypothetical protein
VSLPGLIVTARNLVATQQLDRVPDVAVRF